MLEAVQITDVGCVRTNNEDYSLVDAELGLYVLADGMGGARAGERASHLAVETLAAALRRAAVVDSQALLAAVEEAHARVLEASRNDRTLEGMGTTLVAALETGGILSIASVGDSRAYVLDEDGLRVITDDQTWVNQVGRPMGLDEQSLRAHPMRHVLTMAIGAAQKLAVNFYAVPLRPGAVTLLSSDGLHGVVEPQRLEETLSAARDGAPLDDCARRLVDAARAAGAPDNVTVVLMRKDKTPPAQRGA